MKKANTRSILLSTAGAVALGFGLSLPAAAQSSAVEQAVDDAFAIEEIIVTSRRRAELLQDVPASVTAFTEGVLERAGVQRVEHFINMTPGVSIVNAAEVGDTQVNIRGINGARDAENSFAFIIDGVLMTNPAAFNREFNNLQQIEILKGPQGAIYGRNAAAGAIIVTTKKPGNEFEASAKVSGGNNESYYVAASVGGPLVQDRLYFQIESDWRNTDGFYTNTFLDRDDVTDQFENYNIRGRLVWQPSDQTELDMKARYGKVNGAAITFNAAFALENFAGAFGSPAAFENVNDHEFVFQNNIASDNDQEAIEISMKLDHNLGWADLTGWFLYSDIDNNFISDGTSGAFGFFASDPVCQQSSGDLFAQGFALPAPQFIGTTPVPILVANPAFDANFVPQGSFFGPYTPTTCDGIQEQLRNQTDISVELRLTSPSDQSLRWLVGAYFLDIDRQVGISLNRDTGLAPVRGLFQRASESGNFTEALAWDDFDSTILAVFANIDYDVSDTVELSLALRYDNENRKVTNLVPTDVVTQFVDFDGDFIPGGSPLNPALLFSPGGVAPQSRTFAQLQPKISLTWDATDDLTLYTSWGVGFKSGGFNNTGSAATVDIFFNGFIGLFETDFLPLLIEDTFDKETSSAFEAGFKGNLMDGRLRFDGAFYYVQVDDMQAFEFLVGSFGLLRVVNNIDDVDIKGFEFAVNAQLHDYFTVTAGVNIIDTEIKKNTSRPDTVGNKSPYTPDFTLNLSGEFNYPVTARFSFFARADANWIGDTWFHTVQNQTKQTLNGPLIQLFFCPALGGFPGCDASLGIGNYALTKRDSYMTLDARIGVEGDTWSLTGFARNLTNKKYLEEVIPAPEFGGSFIHPGSRRSWGVELATRF